MYRETRLIFTKDEMFAIMDQHLVMANEKAIVEHSDLTSVSIEENSVVFVYSG